MSVRERSTHPARAVDGAMSWPERALRRLCNRGLRDIVWPATDLACGTAAFLGAFWLRYHIALGFAGVRLGVHTTLYSAAFLLYLPLLALSLFVAGAYRRQVAWNGPGEYRAVMQGVTYALLAVLLSVYGVYRSSDLSRGWLLLVWLLSSVLIVSCRFGLRRLAGRLARAGIVGRAVLIVGVHPEALNMEWYLRRQPSLGLRVMGFIDDALPVGAVVQGGVPVLGTIAAMAGLIHDRHVDTVVVFARATTRDTVLAAVEGTLGTKAEVVLLPDVFTVLSTGAVLVPLPGLPVMQLNKVRLSWGERVVKEVFDRGVGLLLFLVLSPLLLGLAVVSRVKYGAAFETPTVLGQGGVPFRAVKFRTTPVHAPLDDEAVAARRQQGLPIRDDPRLTAYGRFLRRSSLDELAQLWNVLRGQMSLVGPYKIAPQDRGHYGSRWLSVVALKPGITGMAQVHGRGELTLEERSILDAEYVRNYSLWGDLALLIATIPAALRGRGAY